MGGFLGFMGAMNRGYIEVYTGAQPANSDAAKTGTLLGTITSSSLALTKETRATGTITITAAASGSINTITAGGLNIIPDGAVNAVAGDTASTALALAEAINRNGIMEASVSGSIVTIKGRPGSGTSINLAVVTGTLTTVTATYANMAGGVAPVNGLILTNPTLGIVSKQTTQVWSFSGLAIGTAGWFRFYGSDTADTSAVLAAAPWYPRMDGTVAVSGGDMGLSNLSVTVGSPNTVDRFNITLPAA